MTITSDIEKDTKANFAVAEVVNDSESSPPPLTEASYAATEKTATVVTLERSPLELATAVDTEDSNKRQADLCCGSCCDVSFALFFFVLCGLNILVLLH